jgi:PAS domain S-box-containing protein
MMDYQTGSNDATQPNAPRPPASLFSRALRRPGSYLKTLGLVGAVGGLALALVLADLNSRYQAAIDEAKHSAQGFAEVLAEHMARVFEAVDYSLQAAEAIRRDTEVGGNGAARPADHALRQLLQNSSVLASIHWTNANGDVVAHSSGSDPPHANVADLLYFIAQRDGIANGLFIAPPFRPTPEGRWIVTVSLPLRNADGSFAGVVAAELDQSYFKRIFQSMKPGPNGSVTLARRDGRIVAREPFDAAAVSRSIGGDDLFTRYLARAEAGALVKRSPIDGIDRVAAYQATPGLPLVMIVTYDLSDALKPWRDYIQAAGPLAAILLLVLVLGASILSRRSSELARQSALLKATLDNMDQGLVVIDDDSKLAIHNPRALELLDLPASLMAGRPSADEVIAYQTARGEFLETPSDEEAHAVPRLFRVRDVYERTRPDGTVLEIHTVPFGAGSAVRTYKDITKQKRIEQRLREGEARYRLLAECSADMIFQLDLQFVRNYVSPSSLEILGYRPDEMVGGSPLSIIHPEDAERVAAAFRSLAQGLERTAVTNRSRHRDGRWIWVESELRLMRDAETGAPYGILGALRDISARKAIEAEAVAARLQAERAMEAQSQFLATMSHELRTPLNSVLGFTGLILNRTDLAADVRRQLGLIETAGVSLLTVVNDILDFSKIEEGKLDLSPVEFSLAALVADSVSIIRGTASKSSLDVRIVIDPEIASHLIGDEARLRQVLLNLLNNAVKFTREGYVSLRVQTLGAFDAGHRLRFVVADTGIGIAKNKLDRLFHRFSQVDGSTSREYGGTGLGLAICKRLVELMGGEIGVDSVAGRGSVFWFVVTLPAATQAAARIALPPSEPRGMEPLTVLLVEDVEVNREIARSILQSDGHIVDIAADGLEAIAAVEAGDYDLILMDVQMPHMDGVTASKRIRAFEGRKGRVPILAMTANVLPQQVAAFRAAGMNDHLGKPFKREELFAAIERCLAADFQSLLPSAAAEEDGRSPLERYFVEASADPSPTIADRAPAAFHRDTYEAIANLLGREKIDRLLGQLAGQLKDRFAVRPESAQDRSALAKEAHKLVSSAGMLGLVGLSESCARLEAALIAHEDESECLEEVREACQRALAAIASKMARSGAELESA